VAKYDLNSNSLSKTEIAKMSLTGKLAVDLAKAVKAAAADPAPTGGVVKEGISFYELRQAITVDSEKRFTSPTGVSTLLSQQIIAACHQSTYTDVKTLA